MNDRFNRDFDPSAPTAFTLGRDEIDRVGRRVVELVAGHLHGVRERPVFRPLDADERRRLVDQPLPERGHGADEILAAIEQAVLPFPMGNGHPRFFGWVNSPPSELAALTEAIAAAMNPSCAGGNHAAIHLERAVVRWLMELIGFPVAGSHGVLVSGGSGAALTGL